MKYFILIWAGLSRNRLRTVLTMLSIVVAFLLFGLLQSMSLGLRGVYKSLSADRLFVENNVSMTAGLPFSYFERIRDLPGVKAATHWTFFNGYFQKPSSSLVMFATDVKGLFDVFVKLKMPDDQLQAMLHTRTGLIVSPRTAAKYGWKIGDRIPLQSSAWPRREGGNVYQFDLVGIVDVSGYGDVTFPQAFMHYEYLEEARAYAKGTVLYHIVRLNDPQQATAVASSIDAMFANSEYETHTQSDREWAQGQIQQVGDVQLIARSIAGAVLFALLFLTGNTMMQSMRERIPEFAVLKTIGYSDTAVLALVMLESVILCVASCLVGLFFAGEVFKGMQGLFGSVSLPWSVILSSIGMATLMAVISGVPPALRAARLNVVDALLVRS